MVHPSLDYESKKLTINVPKMLRATQIIVKLIMSTSKAPSVNFSIPRRSSMASITHKREATPLPINLQQTWQP